MKFRHVAGGEAFQPLYMNAEAPNLELMVPEKVWIPASTGIGRCGSAKRPNWIVKSRGSF